MVAFLLLCYQYSFFLFFSFFVGHIHMSFFGATGTPVLDFWWRLLWVSMPEWVLPYSHWGGECNVQFLRSTSGATCCRPLDGQHCGASTGFISCQRILLYGSSESCLCYQYSSKWETVSKNFTDMLKSLILKNSND